MAIYGVPENLFKELEKLPESEDEGNSFYNIEFVCLPGVTGAYIVPPETMSKLLNNRPLDVWDIPRTWKIEHS